MEPNTYHDRMTRYLKVLFLGASIIALAGCGNASNVALLRDVEDAVAFLTDGETSVAVMAINGDLLDITPEPSPAPTWPDRDRVIGLACGFNAEVPLLLVSPDGAVLGPPEPGWLPPMSPDGQFAAVACFLDGDTVVLVDDGVSVGGGVRDDWSRSGHAPGSDQVELMIVKTDGSALIEISRNKAADWLPRWSPDGLHILFETTRDGNSEIYIVGADGLGIRNLTVKATVDDLWPAWSRDGHFIAFSSNRSGKGEIMVTDPTRGIAKPTGHHGYPIPWGG